MDQKAHSCYRHQVLSTQLVEEEKQLMETLERIPLKAKIKELWDLYQTIPSHDRYLALDGILHYSCFPQLSYLSQNLSELTKVNFLSILPNEISFKILSFMDAKTLCRSSQTCKAWKAVCDADIIWQRMCSQHINKKCSKCGWGLPLMCPKVGTEDNKRPSDPDVVTSGKKRLKLSTDVITIKPLELSPAAETADASKLTIKPWKKVYAERLSVAKNWRQLHFTQRNLIGHTDAVKCLYFDEQASLLVSASNDCTLRAWNVDTGLCIGILKGHTKPVRCVQFDDSKIVSGSMDKTIRIWNRKTFECVRVIDSHTEGVVSLHFIGKFLAAGAINGIIRVWNLEKGCSFMLQGHQNWANVIRILPGGQKLLSCSDDQTMILWDIFNQTKIKTFRGHMGPIQSLSLLEPQHAPGLEHQPKIVTGSLDHTIKIWDFNSGEVVKTLFGHTDGIWGVGADSIRIVSCSHDGTIKIWDIESGQCIQTISAHKTHVRAVSLSETKLISADEHGMIIVRDFLPPSLKSS